jgi:DNA-binding IscR family transcriptional regulator
VKEKLALLVTFLVGESFYGERPAWTAEALAHRLGTPTEAIDTILDALERGGLLKRTVDEPPSYLPARPMERTEVKRVLDAVRAAEESSYLNFARLPSERGVEELVEHLDRAAQQALHGRTLRDLVESQAATDLRPVQSAPDVACDAAKQADQ